MSTQKPYPNLESMPVRSAWQRGVKAYARDLIANIDGQRVTRDTLLNGAEDWTQWAEGGCGLVYDTKIAERLCTPSELRKKRGGVLPPRKDTSWLELEARAAAQAAHWLIRIYGNKN